MTNKNSTPGKSITHLTLDVHLPTSDKKVQDNTRNYSSEASVELELFGKTDPTAAETEDHATAELPALASGVRAYFPSLVFSIIERDGFCFINYVIWFEKHHVSR